MHLKKEKRCSSCHKTMAIKEYSFEKRSPDGLSSRCKKCRNSSSKVWHEKNKQHVQEYRKARSGSLEQIWQNFCSHKESNGHRALAIDEKTFLSWYSSVPKTCAYCGNTNEDCLRILNILGIKRKPARLEIDRKDNLAPYQIDNMVLACSICNYHKSYFFSYKEFREIALSVLKPKFDLLLKTHS